MAERGVLAGLSPSTVRAVDLARAATTFRLARQRGPGSPPEPSSSSPDASSGDLEVGPPDLLVGVLLAHPDARGEGRVLLEHFGLTARDVLPRDYPKADFADLRRHAAALPESIHPHGLPEITGVLDVARTLAPGQVHLRHLLGALLQHSGQPLRWTDALDLRGVEWSGVAESYRRWLGADPAAPTMIAGESLKAWLERENPRQPVDVPLFASDQVDAGRDLIGIQNEADAFAYLIASRDLTPPLAIGFFGDWGSGKSFLMRAIDRRLDILTRTVADQSQSQVGIWKTVDRIQFNAWEYVQGNLWAGLLERIFIALGTFQPQLVESRRRPVEQEIAEVAQAITAVENRLNQVAKQLGTARDAVKVAEENVADARENAEQLVDQRRREEAQQQARTALQQLWGRLPVFLLGQRGADFVQALSEARAELARGRAIAGPYWRRPQHIVLVSLGALLVPVVAWLLAGLGAGPAASFLGGLAALVPVVTATLSSVTRWGRERLTELDAAEARVQTWMQEPARERERELAEARQQLTAVTARHQAVQDEQRRTVAQREQLDAALARLTPERILVEFADQRSAEYRSRLGPLAEVRRDLLAVEAAILESNQKLRSGEVAPAPETSAAQDGSDGPRRVPNRIVLYIDDLDRCPPDTVLEVLEAVHLLLSFRMFVVVVAVDSRWLTSALTDQLVALRPDDANRQSADAGNHVTPNDYLEKIFQLPFWVQPVPPPGRAQLVHGLLADSVRPAEDGEGDHPDHGRAGIRLGDREQEAVDALLVRHGVEARLDTSPLALEPADLAFFEGLAVLLGDTPRRVKRFVNTCQLLYAMTPPLRNHAGFPGDRQVVALVCAISEGLPTIAARWLPELATCGASVPNRPPEVVALGATTLLSHATALPEAPVSPMGAAPGAVALAAERARLLAWLGLNPQWQGVTLSQLEVRLAMIRRMRFQRPVVGVA